MLNTSNQFKSELYNDNRDYLCYADITLADGTVLNLKDKNIWTDSFSLEDAVSGTGSFDIGSAIINKLTLSINNIYEAYSVYDFTDAVVVPYVGLDLPDGTVEKIRKGVFTVDEASYDGSLITLNCLDNMYKLDYAYAESNLSYPATLGAIVRDICYVCGVTLLTSTFLNSSYVVSERPADESLTCRQVLSWVAQIACSWARFDTYGRLKLDWYDLSAFENRDGLNGGIFDEGNPYQSGDTAFGGTFNPWTKGDNVSGGTFQDLNRYHHIYSMSTMQICTDDVVITGLKVTESFEETDVDKVQSYLFGTEGYVIAIEGNDLIQKGKAEVVARSIGGKVVGMRFRPFDVSALDDPAIEAGDPVIVTDRKQRSYQSYVTSTTFKVGNYQQIQCSAKTPSRNSAQRFAESTRNIVKAKKETARKISNYEKAMNMLTSLITQSFGVFKTEEKLEDGSTIFYLHDKPTLNQSMTIWKMTAEAFAVTTDGGKTWNAGMDANGNVVVNVLSAIGINAEWINTGELVVKDEEGNITLLANVDTGQVIINAESIAISGKSVQDIASSAASGAVNAQTQTDIFNKLTNNGKAQGLYIQNGQLYVNGEYIQAKGLKVIDKNGTTTLYVNNDGQVTLNVASLAIIGKAASTQEYANSQANSALSAAKTYADSASKSAVNAQTQMDIFNKLTNNGALKGIYMQDGQLYINASYLVSGYMSASRINGGTLYLGGNNNGNGLCVIRDASNNEIGRLSNAGINFLKGMIRLGSLFSVDTSGNVTANSLKSSNAQITGGSVRITSQTENYNYIILDSGRIKTNLSTDGLSIAGSGGGEYTTIGYSDIFVKGSSGVFSYSDLMCIIESEIQISFKTGRFIVDGTKNRVVKTQNFGEVLQYCYETSSPMFGDIGTGMTDESGLSYIYFDQIFQETITPDMTYYVFLQKEGEGDLWIEEKNTNYFLVKGTPRLSFSWEIKAKQRDYEYERMESFDKSNIGKDIDYGAQANAYLKSYEKEILDYEKIN